MANNNETQPEFPHNDAKHHLSDPEVVRREYSDLEVDGTQHFSDPEAVRVKYSTLEAVPGSDQIEGMRSENLQAYHPDVNTDAEGAIPYHPGVSRDAGLILSEKNHEHSVDRQKRQTICGVRGLYFWVLIAVILLLVGGIVGGVVGGTRHNGTKEGSSTVTNSGSSTGSGIPAATSAAVHNGIRQNSNLAAIAWNVSSTQYQYRVYYQDEDNSIKESAYDSSSGSWKVQTIINGSLATPGTSIAAAASKKASSGGDSVSVSLYFLDTDLEIAVISSSTSGTWSSTPSNSTGKPNNRNAQGRLAAYYHECELCPNRTLLAYASNGTVILYNGTSPAAWEGTSFILEENTADGSELSFQPYSIMGYADQLNMYYQRSDDNLVLTSWFSSDYQRDHNLDLSADNSWQDNGNNGVVGKIVSNASLATLYFGNNNGSPEYVEAITSGTNNDGLQVYEWTNGSWKSPVMPSQLQEVSTATAIAAHFYQRVYALVEGTLTQFAVADDGSTWTVIGDVPTL